MIDNITVTYLLKILNINDYITLKDNNIYLLGSDPVSSLEQLKNKDIVIFDYFVPDFSSGLTKHIYQIYEIKNIEGKTLTVLRIHDGRQVTCKYKPKSTKHWHFSSNWYTLAFKLIPII